jgi:hypothetical protein
MRKSSTHDQVALRYLHIGKLEMRENQSSLLQKVNDYNVELTYIQVLLGSMVTNYTLYVQDHN